MNRPNTSMENLRRTFGPHVIDRKEANDAPAFWDLR